VTPPVIVTPVIEPASWLVPSPDPIVTTGPPPEMIVAGAPAPASVRLVLIVKPPW
jgi:hypothetical protein